MTLTSVLARPLLASAFVLDGVDALLHPDQHVERYRKVEPLLEKAGVPPMLSSDAAMVARLAGGISTVAGLALAAGRRPRTAALILVAVNLPLTVVNNPVWAAENADERNRYVAGLTRGASVAGGLFLAAADRAGRPSLGWRVSNSLEHRAQVREAKRNLKERLTD